MDVAADSRTALPETRGHRDALADAGGGAAKNTDVASRAAAATASTSSAAVPAAARAEVDKLRCGEPDYMDADPRYDSNIVSNIARVNALHSI